MSRCTCETDSSITCILHPHKDRKKFMNAHSKLYTSSPINKNAALVTNQSGCDDKPENLNLVEERKILRENINGWTNMSIKSSKHHSSFKSAIKNAKLRLGVINRKLKAYDLSKQKKKYSSYNEVLIMVIRQTLDKSIMQGFTDEAKELWQLHNRRK